MRSISQHPSLRGKVPYAAPCCAQSSYTGAIIQGGEKLVSSDPQRGFFSLP